MIVPDNISLNYYELILTENCNLRCKYCYDGYYSDRTTCDYNTKMDSNFIKNFIPFVLETFDRNSEIIFSFFGGEPTMNWNFITELVNEAEKHFKFPYTYTINTNAMLLDSEKIDFLIKNKFAFGVSIDGTEEAHNINRITVDGHGSWTKTMQILPEIIVKSRKNNMETNVLMVITENNYHLLSESYEMLIKLGAQVNLLFDYVYEMSDELLEDIRKQLEYLFLEKNYRLPVEFNRRVLREGNTQEDAKTYCFIPNKNVSISPEGKLFFCHQLVPKMYEIDENFDEYYGNIVDGWTNLDYYLDMCKRTNFKEFKTNKRCENCRARAWCAGGCIAAHKHFTGDYYKLNENLCKLNLTINDICTKINI